MSAKKKSYKKVALTLSTIAIILWTLLGAGTSLAWFSDTSSEVNNIFNFSKFELAVSQKQKDGNYKQINSETKIFDDNAIYEPGFVQTVYLKIENKGSADFDLKTALCVTDYTSSVNVFGRTFCLQDYLLFGITVANSENELNKKITSHVAAKELSTTPLNNYFESACEMKAGETVYMAIIVRMPEEVGNKANYRGNTAPTLTMGLSFEATQKRNR